MEKPFQIAISNGLTAPAIQVQSPEDLSTALRELDLHSPRPILVVVGGASKVSEADLSRLRLLFVKVLAPLAEELGASVVDGGTDVGVMQMMGQARAEIAATFPLIGVTPAAKVALPDRIPSSKVTALEPHHTHFVLVPGSNWGDESPWLARLASVLSEGFPSVTLVVNGGEITFQDVSYSVQADRPVVALDGSGRTADKLAAALRGEATDRRAKQLAASGQVQSVDLIKNPARLATVITMMLSRILHL